jgi:hypothetical protein
LRKIWKEVGLGFLTLLLLVAIIVLAQPWLRRHGTPLLGAAMVALLCVAAYAAASKWIERHSPTELATDRALQEGLAGMALGFVLFSVVMGILWAAGTYRLGGKGAADQIAKGFVLAVLAGILEEILFRGLLFRLSAKIFGTWGRSCSRQRCSGRHTPRIPVPPLAARWQLRWKRASYWVQPMPRLPGCGCLSVCTLAGISRKALGAVRSGGSRQREHQGALTSWPRLPRYELPVVQGATVGRHQDPISLTSDSRIECTPCQILVQNPFLVNW